MTQAPSRQSIADKITTAAWLSESDHDSIDIFSFIQSLDGEDRLLALISIIDSGVKTVKNLRRLMPFKEELEEIQRRNRTAPVDTLLLHLGNDGASDMSLRLGLLTPEQLYNAGTHNDPKFFPLVKAKLANMVWGLDGDVSGWDKMITRIQTPKDSSSSPSTPGCIRPPVDLGIGL